MKAEAVAPRIRLTAGDTAPSPRRPASVTEASAQRLDTSELWALRRDAPTPAREELMRRFLPLARNLASRYRTVNEPFEDLVQVASVGLLGAVDRFDPDRGTPFVSFAIPTVLGELKRYFRDLGWAVRVPRGAQELAMRVEETRWVMADGFGRSPRVAELAEFMHLEVDDVLDALQTSKVRFCISLDTPVDQPGSGTVTLGETLGAEDDSYSRVEARIDLEACIRRLPYPQRTALALRLGQDLKQREIAERLGCSQMQVSRLLVRAIKKVGASRTTM
jgi:RNA polymerase sigma-B factor